MKLAIPEGKRLRLQDAAIQSITNLICDLMKRQGVSQRELAQRLGCSQPNVAQLLNGSKNMTIRTVADVLAHLGHELRVTCRRL